jgi:hypothetical protein
VPALVPPEPDLSNEAVLLRPWRDMDVPALTAACQDSEIPPWTVVPLPYRTLRYRQSRLSWVGVA